MIHEEPFLTRITHLYNSDTLSSSIVYLYYYNISDLCKVIYFNSGASYSLQNMLRISLFLFWIGFISFADVQAF